MGVGIRVGMGVGMGVRLGRGDAMWCAIYFMVVGRCRAAVGILHVQSRVLLPQSTPAACCSTRCLWHANTKCPGAGEVVLLNFWPPPRKSSNFQTSPAEEDPAPGWPRGDLNVQGPGGQNLRTGARLLARRLLQERRR